MSLLTLYQTGVLVLTVGAILFARPLDRRCEPLSWDVWTWGWVGVALWPVLLALFAVWGLHRLLVSPLQARVDDWSRQFEREEGDGLLRPVEE